MPCGRPPTLRSAWEGGEVMFSLERKAMALPKLGGHLIVFGPKYTMDNDAEFILDSVKEAGYTAVEGGMAGDAETYKKHQRKLLWILAKMRIEKVRKKR